jgi:hypothetical protein
MGLKETLISQRAHVTALERQLTDARRQNTKLRDALLHTCAVCRVCLCPERERLFLAALGRQVQTIRNPKG